MAHPITQTFKIKGMSIYNSCKHPNQSIYILHVQQLTREINCNRCRIIATFICHVACKKTSMRETDHSHKCTVVIIIIVLTRWFLCQNIKSMGLISREFQRDIWFPRHHISTTTDVDHRIYGGVIKIYVFLEVLYPDIWLWKYISTYFVNVSVIWNKPCHF